MKKHTKVYFDFFGYDTSSWIGCEVCGTTAVDIHHIDSRGMGGSGTKKDVIENLMAVCRECHNKYGDIKELIEPLITIHTKHINHHLKRRS